MLRLIGALAGLGLTIAPCFADGCAVRYSILMDDGGQREVPWDVFDLAGYRE